MTSKVIPEYTGQGYDLSSSIEELCHNHLSYAICALHALVLHLFQARRYTLTLSFMSLHFVAIILIPVQICRRWSVLVPF
jgi:hypothetical protein